MQVTPDADGSSPTKSPLPARKQRRWLPRFSLRTLLVMMLVVGVCLGTLGNYWRRLVRQRQIVAAIEAVPGSVSYDYQFGSSRDLEQHLDVDIRTIRYGKTDDGRRERTITSTTGETYEVETAPGPRWLRSWLGDDAFTRVDSIDFSIEEPQEFDPELLRELPGLRTVVLVGPQVNDEWLAIVSRIPNLRCVALYGDDKATATSAGLAQLNSARTLEFLTFTGEWVTDDVVAGIADMRSLRSLGFASVPNITSGTWPHLRNLTNMEDLYLFKADKLGDEGSKSLSRMTKLRRLTIRGAAISDPTLINASGLTRIELLDVGWTQVGDRGVESLGSLANLKILNLDGTNATDACFAAIAHLPRLRKLSAPYSTTGLGLRDIAGMPQLKQLDLYPSWVSDDGLMELQSMQQLEELDVGPHVTLDGANALRAALPNCEISRYDEAGNARYPDR
jgi:hypothetical protein